MKLKKAIAKAFKELAVELAIAASKKVIVIAEEAKKDGNSPTTDHISDSLQLFQEQHSKKQNNI